jgi:hypothetical protein
MGLPRRRKMLAADEELANRIVEMAKRRGATVFQTVNFILEEALRAEEMGVSLREVVDKRWMLERARRLGLVFAPERLLYEMVDLAYTRVKRRVSKIWFEVGKWYGEYFSDKEAPLKVLEEAMELLTFGSSYYSLKDEGDRISLSIVGDRFTEGYTEALSLFIEGVFKALGYEATSKEVSRGAIHYRFGRRDRP